MTSIDDLAEMFQERPDVKLRFGQGEVISWDHSTLTNTIKWRGGDLHDVHVLSDVNALTIQPEDLVVMLGAEFEGGVSTWWVLGKIVSPGEGATDLVIRGGNLIVGDGGGFGALYPSGMRGALFGPLRLASTGEPNGHGLLIQADGGDQPDIFRAKQTTTGETQVFIGMTPADSGAIDEFISLALSTQIHNYGDRLLLQSHNDGDIEILSDERLWLYGDDEVTVSCPNGNIQVLSTGGMAGLGGLGGTYLTRQDGGSVTANVHMAADGQILRVGSTERIKRDITDFEADPAVVLQLRPRSWLPGPVERHCPPWVHEQHDGDECHEGEVIEPPEDARRQVGFVAEELDGLGLGDFVEYDSSGLPTSIHYDRLSAALIPVLQQQQAQIEALTARLDALEQPNEGA